MIQAKKLALFSNPGHKYVGIQQRMKLHHRGNQYQWTACYDNTNSRIMVHIEAFGLLHLTTASDSSYFN